MKTTQKLALCLALALLAAPLSGCGDTWDGMKQDWHDVTSSNDDADEQPAVSTAQATEQQPAVVSTTTTTTTATATTAQAPASTDGWTINP